MQINETTLTELLGRLAGELAGAWGMVSIHLGVRLGLYDALRDGPVTAQQLATRTGCNERLVQEWLSGQVVAGYLAVDATDHYYLTVEQAAVLADTAAPTYMGGFSEVLAATIRSQEQIDAAFCGTGALAWGDQNPELSGAFERCVGPLYRDAVVSAWIPALDGVQDRLEEGARVADIGAGHGTATVVMGQTFPASTFTAVDVHADSLDAAAKQAADAGLGARVRTLQASGVAYDGGPYDLVTFFDSLHDMGDPDRVIANTRRQLADSGTVLVVEPMVASGPDDPGGTFAARLFYPSSAMLCTPSAMDGGALALGNQVPDATWRRLFLDNGFGSFERVAETPFVRVFAARP